MGVSMIGYGGEVIYSVTTNDSDDVQCILVPGFISINRNGVCSVI